jgi:hypothetical protein
MNVSEECCAKNVGGAGLGLQVCVINIGIILNVLCCTIR